MRQKKERERERGGEPANYESRAHARVLSAFNRIGGVSTPVGDYGGKAAADRGGFSLRVRLCARGRHASPIACCPLQGINKRYLHRHSYVNPGAASSYTPDKFNPCPAPARRASPLRVSAWLALVFSHFLLRLFASAFGRIAARLMLHYSTNLPISDGRALYVLGINCQASKLTNVSRGDRFVIVWLFS